MSDFFLGCSIALFFGGLLNKFFKNQSLENKQKTLLLAAVAAFVLSLILGWEDILQGFRDGFNMESTKFKDLSA